MDHEVEETSKSIEVWLFFAMLGMSVVFTPIAATCYSRCPIKLVLCISLICIMIGSISFIVCTNVWVWVIIQSTFTTFGCSTI